MQDELEIMKKIAQLLEPLSAAARTRVVAWVISALEVRELSLSGGGVSALKAGSLAAARDEPAFSTFAEFFHAAAPKTEKERALLAAYWIQRSGGVEQFASQQINTELKHIGYGVTNITDALTQLINDRPSLAIQLAKSGQSKQARKTYKVTDAGFRHVAAMLGVQANG
jgi:hypothetical protein